MSYLKVDTIPLVGNEKIFGSEHTIFGHSLRDLILRTRGKIKVLWASKFIDIIKDGKLNVEIKDPFTVYQTKSLIDYSVNGLVFVMDEEAFYLIYDGKEYPLTTSDGEFVSYKERQNTSGSDKQTAQMNMGLVYASLEEVQDDIENEKLLPNSFLYLLEDNQLYFVNSSKNLVNPYYPKTGGEVTGKVIITTTEANALEIQAGKNIRIGSTFYSDTEIRFGSNFKLGSNVTFEGSRLIINLVTVIKEVVSDYIHSNNFTVGQAGFGMYIDGDGNAVVEADKFISRNDLYRSANIDGTNNFYIANWCDIVSLVDIDDETQDPENPIDPNDPVTEGLLTLSKQLFNVGEVGRIAYQELIVVNPNLTTYEKYNALHLQAHQAYLDGTSKYTPESITAFNNVISAYNSSLPSPTAINPDDGSTVNITIDVTDELSIILPETYYTTEENDIFDFNGKVIALQDALSRLSSTSGGHIDITITEVDGLNITGTLSYPVVLSNLLGKKIFKLNGNVMRMFSENSNGNLDLYTDIVNLSDMEPGHINTRIGDVSPFLVTAIGVSPVPSLYLTQGLYTKAAYITGGVIREPNGGIKIDLTIPANTLIGRGKIQSVDGSIVIDLENNTLQMSMDLQGVTDKGNTTTKTISAAQAVNGNELTTLDLVNNMMRDPAYVSWLRTQLGL